MYSSITHSHEKKNNNSLKILLFVKKRKTKTIFTRKFSNIYKQHRCTGNTTNISCQFVFVCLFRCFCRLLSFRIFIFNLIYRPTHIFTLRFNLKKISSLFVCRLYCIYSLTLHTLTLTETRMKGEKNSNPKSMFTFNEISEFL